MEYIIDTDTLDLAVVDGAGLLLDPKGEDILLTFYKIKSQVEEAERVLKELINLKMDEINPNQKSIVGDHVRITRTTRWETGRKYSFSGEYDSEFSKRTERVYLNPDSLKIDDYFKKNKKIPDGITKNKQSKSVDIEVEL